MRVEAGEEGGDVGSVRGEAKGIEGLEELGGNDEAIEVAVKEVEGAAKTEGAERRLQSLKDGEVLFSFFDLGA